MKTRSINIFSLAKYYQGNTWFWFMGVGAIFFATVFFALLRHPSLRVSNNMLLTLGALTTVFLFSFLAPHLTIKTCMLCKNGQVKKGVITAMEIHVALKSPAYVWVSYCYKGINGNDLYGRSRTGAEDLRIMDEKKIGDDIYILVSQTNEAKSCIVPRLKVYQNYWEVPADYKVAVPLQHRITTNRPLLLILCVACFAGALLPAFLYGNNTGANSMRTVLEAAHYILFLGGFVMAVLLLMKKKNNSI